MALCGCMHRLGITIAMTLAVCIVDTRDHDLAAQITQRTLDVLQQCHPAQKVYWISDKPAPINFSVPCDVTQISPIQHFPLDYNRVCLHMIPALIQDDHCLIIQTDGYAVNHHAWTPQFLTYDYVGACWPMHWNLPHQVGNGGFSLRSRKLLQALKHMRVQATHHHEDFLISLDLRDQLCNQYGCVWAPELLADQFSIENHMQSVWLGKSFGFHGKHLKPIYERI